MTLPYPKEQSVDLDHLEVEKGFNSVKAGPVDDLVASAKEVGITNAIHVRRRPADDGKYVDGKMFVIDGHRRLLAAQKAGLKEVPVIDHGLINDVEAKTIAYQQNLLRRKPTKKERIDTCRFFEKAGLGVSEIARRTFLAKSTVSEYLTISRAAPKLRNAAAKTTAEGGIPTKTALKAAKMTKDQQRKATPKLVGKTNRQAEHVIGPVTASPGQAPKPTNKIGMLAPGGKLAPGYRLVSDYKERCQKLELEVTKRLRQTPSNQRLQGMELVIGVLRGKLTVEQAFTDWQKV